MLLRRFASLALAGATLVHLVDPPIVRACGCLSPPLPPPLTDTSYAVNQSGEQIIFEVEPGWVTAHVLIRYAGDPSQFAWIIPVPEVPDLATSPTAAFGLLDRATAPNVGVYDEDLCPRSAWACHYDEPSSIGGCGASANHSSGGGFAADAGAAGDGGPGGQVTVISEQTVGNYQTVIFQASDAAAAVQWLQSNGFIVNSTTSIYMESYIQANMVFVAAKLVPGAGIKAIQPLRLHYRAAYPSIPLVLTAVAAQPHLTVTAFVYANQPYRPMGHPLVTIPPDRLAKDPSGRFNYPMVLARAVDEVGGDGFAVEYSGYASPSTVGTSYCCTGTYDVCGVGNDGLCECPSAPFDANDCAQFPDLEAGVTLLQQLGQSYTSLTRLTTRISPEEMTFDPAFEPDPNGVATGALSVIGKQPTLATCASSVIDQATYADVVARESCAAVYCGAGGQCVTTAHGPACACDASSVAQQFTDLDGNPSVTCAPAKAPVDLRAGGAQLPDACASADCGDGQCIDRNGIPVCTCPAGEAATRGALSPRCEQIERATNSPGAESFAEPLRALSVCAPPPPTCYGDAKLELVGTQNPGVDCGNATPPPSRRWHSGGGCQPGRDTPFAVMGVALVVLATLLRRRRGALAR